MPTARFLLLAIGAALFAACASAPPAAPALDVQTLLTAQADAWDRAIVAKDAAGIDANIAADFTQIQSNGAVIGKAQFIVDLLDPNTSIDPYRVEDFGVRVYGDTALLTGRIRMTGVEEGKRFESHFRYIDVYVRRAGRWQVVSIQVTRMPP
jgi:ketosteroid isomerase-like protein